MEFLLKQLLFAYTTFLLFQKASIVALIERKFLQNRISEDVHEFLLKNSISISELFHSAIALFCAHTKDLERIANIKQTILNTFTISCDESCLAELNKNLFQLLLSDTKDAIILNLNDAMAKLENAVSSFRSKGYFTPADSLFPTEKRNRIENVLDRAKGFGKLDKKQQYKFVMELLCFKRDLVNRPLLYMLCTDLDLPYEDNDTEEALIQRISDNLKIPASIVQS